MAVQQIPTQQEHPVSTLIQAGRTRDAIALCAREYGAALGRLCMALLGNQAEAEETVQEALIAAYGGFGSWRGGGSPRAWLMGIARRMCARRLAKRSRREDRLRLVHDAGREQQLPDDVLYTRRRAATVRQALELLKPSDREIVLLRFESQLSYRSIAELSDIDEPAARKRISRALIRLRDALKTIPGGLS